MKLTKVFVNILCFLCVVCFGTVGYVAESSGQARVSIAFDDLVRDLRYDWRPKAGSSLSFTVKVTKPPYYSGGRLTAELSDVTSYLGSCGNRTSLYNDLELRQDLIHNSGWRSESPNMILSHPIRVNNTNATTYERITLRVDCEDYAAYGKLTFTASGSTGNAFPIVITIPRDVNGNKIADCWRDDETTAHPNNKDDDPNNDYNVPSKNWVESWDEESGPANNSQRGDGIAVLDEYRGIDINGTWTDTDPEGWDVFVRSESSQGLGVASSLPGMTCHQMGLTDVDHNVGLVHDFKVIPTPPHGMVYAIRLESNPDAFDPLNPGRRFGEMELGPPSSGTKGLVFPERIRGWARAEGIGNHVDTLINHITGHEIAHGVHLRHCPQGHGDHLNCYMWSKTDTMSPHESQWHSHYDEDYDIKQPAVLPQAPFVIPAGKKRHYGQGTGIWLLIDGEQESVIITPADGENSGETNSQNTTNSENIISTNTGSSTYGCDYNAEYDYCTDTGTCTTRTDATGIGMCGHRWCCCAPVGTETSSTPSTSPSTSVTSTNTGYSHIYGCDYNAEYDYCTDTGTCTTRTGSDGVGMCGHRWCCCAPQ